MSDIVISHVQEDLKVADALARALVERGWRVLVDRSATPAGPRYDRWIGNALGKTRCVLVLWSEHSVMSDSVWNQAYAGLMRDILVPVILKEGVEVPLAFRHRQSRLLLDWTTGHEGSPDLPSHLVDDLVRVLGAPAWKPRASALVGPLDLEDLGSEAWVSIAGATFTMGGPESRPDVPHRVTLSPFKISRFPVTNEQYRGVVQAGLVKAPEHWTDGSIPERLEQHPVVNVAWDDAATFVRWFGARVRATWGGTVQLPTEAQWEYVARGTEGRAYPWGNTRPSRDRANYGGQVGATTPVNAYPAGATPDGVLDMAGNVWEWCRDWYGPLERSATSDPTGPTSGRTRVLRGGSYGSGVGSLRGLFRPYAHEVNGHRKVGFRVVWSLGNGRR